METFEEFLASSSRQGHVNLFFEHGFLTRDIDLLIRRPDLEKMVAVATAMGYTAKRMIGRFSLLLPGQELAEAIHLLFVGEKPKSSYPVANPGLNPDRKDLFGFTIPVAPLLDLITLNLNSLRPKDVVHLDVLDQVGFLTPAIVSVLHPILQERSPQARQQFARDKEF